MLNKLQERKKDFVVVFLFMAVLSVVFLNSFYWPHKGIGERKIVAGFIAFFIAFVIPVMAISIENLYKIVARILGKIKALLVKIREDKKNVIFCCALIMGMVVISSALTKMVSAYIWKTRFNIHLLYMFLTMSAILLGLIYLWKEKVFKAENIFVLLAVALGVFSIGVTPDWTGVSWDDEIHYARALELSNVLNDVMYKADEINIGEYTIKIGEHLGYERNSYVQNRDRLDAIYESKELVSHEFTYFNFSSVSSIPSAIGIILGRGLNLSYTSVFNMGRLFNLLPYIVLFYLAIKRLKYGKVLAACIGLIPTSIFMASSYSYDSWVTAFTVLGFAYFIRELQEETYVTYKSMIIMIGSLTLGCLPKAIYFPLLFPLLFMPTKKFKDKKQQKVYYAMVIGAALFLIGTFLLPMLIGGTGTGDARGGTEVNATEQIKFILHNPWQYAKILYQFLLSYISIGNAGAMLQKFSYVGDGGYYGIVCLILAVVAFLDTEDTDNNHTLVKGMALLANTGVIVLASTALYIDFTAVASTTIAGVQGRYLIPTIFPALYSLGWCGTKHKINKNAFACVPMLIIASTFIYNMYLFCIKFY